jgi:hypothetical protein
MTSQAVRRTHLSDPSANRKMDPMGIIYPPGLTKFSQRLGHQDMRILNEMRDFYDDIVLGYQVWDDKSITQFIDFDSAQCHASDHSMQMHVQGWMNLA